jgi:hypothetical protein
MVIGYDSVTDLMLINCRNVQSCVSYISELVTVGLCSDSGRCY